MIKDTTNAKYLKNLNYKSDQKQKKNIFLTIFPSFFVKSISVFFSEIPTEFANQTKIGIREIRVLRNNKCNRFSMNLALV